MVCTIVLHSPNAFNLHSEMFVACMVHVPVHACVLTYFPFVCDMSLLFFILIEQAEYTHFHVCSLYHQLETFFRSFIIPWKYDLKHSK